MIFLWNLTIFFSASQKYLTCLKTLLTSHLRKALSDPVLVNLTSLVGIIAQNNIAGLTRDTIIIVVLIWKIWPRILSQI